MTTIRVGASGTELYDDQTRRVRVYLCVVDHGDGHTSTHFVLSHDADSAKGMAECAAGVALYESTAEIHAKVKTTVSPVPLIVQGWGKKAF